jgi:hypothetical protein
MPPRKAVKKIATPAKAATPVKRKAALPEADDHQHTPTSSTKKSRASEPIQPSKPVQPSDPSILTRQELENLIPQAIIEFAHSARVRSQSMLH